MTKAAICLICSDIISPYAMKNGEWRWCECEQTGTRWRDAREGHLEVTGMNGPEYVMVLGLNNSFLLGAVKRGSNKTNEWWREIHQYSAREVPDNYLFNVNKRDCWALLIRVGETGDVFFVPYQEAKGED